ncbi:sister chromatid cohesion protein PDS5 homolog B-like [Argentina anserina]|uniref:sister chromatid cohesion protein PDS5 homolog B-like n=1 Tax=Argentina anserina TaxID=57926 RepID=UPI0021763523|nr:sister chromatid cohesion protein PDS5 homolog B-like [Potentilla anserina]
MAESALLLVAKIGNQLRRQTRPNKDSVVKSLREATAAFAEIEQPSGSNKKDATRKLEAAIEPLKETIVKGLLRHRDKDVRLLVAICATEIMRLMSPEPPFEDKDLRDVFKLLVSVFAELGDTANSLFSRRAKIVEIVAKLKCCVIMLDIEFVYVLKFLSLPSS